MIQEEGSSNTSSEYPVGLLYLIISSQLRWIAEVIINYMSINDPLDLRPHYEGIFDTVEYILYPIGGVLTDLSQNRFLMVLLANVVLEIPAQIILYPLFIIKNYSVAKILLFVGSTIMVVHGVISTAAYNVLIIDQFAYPEELSYLLNYVQTELILKSANQIFAVFLPPLVVSKKINKNITITMTTLCITVLVLSVLIFYAGRKYYVIKAPKRKFVLKLFPCIFLALRKKLKRKSVPLPHWMDNAAEVYGEDLVTEAKAFLRMLFIFFNSAAILVITDSITHDKILYGLNIRLGTHDRLVNHARLLMPIASIIAYVIFIKCERLMRKINFDRPFRRIFLGLSFSLLTLLYLTILAFMIMKNKPPSIDVNTAQVRIFNAAPCPCLLRSSKLFQPSKRVGTSESSCEILNVDKYKTHKIRVTCPCLEENNISVFIQGGEATSFYLYPIEQKINVIAYEEIVETSKDTNMAIITILGADLEDVINLKNTDGQNLMVPPNFEYVAEVLLPKPGPRFAYDIIPDTHKLIVNNIEMTELQIGVGGIYNIMITNSTINLSVTKEPNDVPFYWWLPVGCLHAAATYFYVTGSIDLIYSESPPSLRGTAESFHVFAKGIGIHLARQLAPDIDLEYCFIYNACLLSFPFLCLAIASYKMKSMYPGRKLV